MTAMNQQRFDEIEAEYEPKASLAALSGTFQTVLTLCLSFMVIAAIRTPSLTEQNLERAALLERLRNAIEREQAKDAKLASYDTILDPPRNLSETEAMEWLSGVTNRIQKGESDAVEQIQFASLDAKYFPSVADLSDLVKLDHAGQVVHFDKNNRLQIATNHDVPENATKWLAAWRDKVGAAITDAVAQKVATKKELFFDRTREAIAAKARTLLSEHLTKVYAQHVAQTAAGQNLDWSAFAASGGQAASRDTYPATFLKYAVDVCALVPNPQLIPDTDAAVKCLDEKLQEQFAAKCKTLNKDDEDVADRIRATADGQPLDARHLYLADQGRQAVEDFVRTEAQCVPGAVPGPRAKAAFQEVADRLFGDETKRVQGQVLNGIRQIAWTALAQRGCQIGYDDYNAEAAKIEELAKQLPACLSLPTDRQPTDVAFAGSLTTAARARASELFQEQIAKGHTAIHDQVLALIQQCGPNIKAGTATVAKTAVSHPDVARGEILEAIYAKLGIQNPKAEHKAAWEEAARQMIALAVQERRNEEGKKLAESTHEILGDTLLNKLTILDRNRRENRVTEIQAELVRRAPLEFHSDGVFKRAQQAEAERLFDERMAAIEAAFQQKAEARIQQLVANQTATQWQQFTEEQIADIVYLSLMQELAKELATSGAE